MKFIVATNYGLYEFPFTTEKACVYVLEEIEKENEVYDYWVVD